MQFISEYQIQPSLCDALISLYKVAYKQNIVTRGHVGTASGPIVDEKIKDSYDLLIRNVPDNLLTQYHFSEFIEAVKIHIISYLEEHSILSQLGRFQIGETPVIQYYKPGGGFKVSHFERSSLSSTTRWLTWMVYLNDIQEARGTYFDYQDFMATPKQGKLLLWPSDFTHTHKGIIAPNEEKYIITGWLNFY